MLFIRRIFLFFVLVTLCDYYANANDDTLKETTDFSLDLYRLLFKQDSNLVYSPYSLRMVLDVIYQASHGDTEKEFREKANYGEKSKTATLQKESISHTLSSPNVKLANKFYVKEGGQLLESFTNLVRDLGMSVDPINFSNSEVASKTMNDWVEKETNGLIKDLILPSHVDSDTTLFILNTLYFKAKWLNPFSKRDIKKHEFTGIDGVKYETDMMFAWNYHKIAKHINSEILELPYENGSNFVMWFILPDESHSISDVLPLVNRQSIKEIDGKFVSDGSNIRIPLFEIETSVNGKELLTKFGMTSMFIKKDLEILENDRPLKVDNMQQKVKITVNGDGTEAASGTFANLIPETIWPDFYATRPFIYMLLTADTKEIAFVGHYVKPN